MLKELGDNVEKQKMAAIGATNLLKSIAKDRESEQAKLQVSTSHNPILEPHIFCNHYRNVHTRVPRFSV